MADHPFPERPSTVTVVSRQPIRRYGWIARKIRTTKVRQVIRRRAKAKKQQDRTAADNANGQARRSAKKDLNAAIDDALRVVWHEAELLAERFPTHNVRYFCQLLLQHGKKKLNARKLTSWNTYLSMRTREINESEWKCIDLSIYF
jgi:hypothetical protein